MCLPTSRTQTPLSLFPPIPLESQDKEEEEEEGKYIAPEKKPCLITSRKKTNVEQQTHQAKQARQWDYGKEPREEICPMRPLAQHHPHLLLKALPLWEKSQPTPLFQIPGSHLN